LRIQTKNLRIDELAGQLANHPVVINFPKLAIFIAAISEDMYLRYLAASLPAKQIIDLYTDEIDASENSLMLVDKSLKILRVHGPSPLKPVYIVSLEDFKALQRAQDSQSLILSVMEN